MTTKEVQSSEQTPAGKPKTFKGRSGVTVTLADVQRGPRTRLCELLKLKTPTDVQLFEDAAAEIERLRRKG